ncbi:hypothetical protein BZL41_20795 [Pseudomonas sp. PIC25]|uniref:hypothetical protein n=1 Tax=Pseudomonas sp. PIC25 TaxID=1958773 RepID=UPI000BABCE14|nr:hypothetical protein [Pseudomonas sp. PIC25]PAU55739.1 hypothetical protein BZL41_20795 [Pseudomonas sp. PIC25]
MEFVVPRARPLAELLRGASAADLNALADLITDNGKGRVALDSSVKARILSHKAKGSLHSIAQVLAAEISAFGGNSIANLFRSSGVSYLELATDVAKKVGGKPAATDDIYDIEDIVINLAGPKYLGKNAPKDHLDNAAMAAYIGQLMTALLINAGNAAGIASAGGAAGIASAIGGRLVTLVAPPVAVGVAGATIIQATAPAFRITIPAVLQVAKIRRTRFNADFAAYTEKLRACM